MAASSWLSGSSRACASASLNSKCASPDWPEESAIVPSTQLRSEDGAVASAAGANPGGAIGLDTLEVIRLAWGGT